MKKLKGIITVFIFVITSLNVAAIEENDDEIFSPVEIKDGSKISIIECISVAYQNNPQIRKKKYLLDVAKSNLEIAKSQYFPIINAGVGFYNENNSDSIYYDTHYRDLPNVGVSINKLIWNFGKTTSFIKMENFYKIAAEYEFMDCLCSVLFDVKAKYYNLLKEKSLLQLYKLNLDLSKNIIDISTEKTDKLNAKTNMAKAEILLNKKQQDYNNARINLNNVMYYNENKDYDILNTQTFPYNNDFDGNINKNDIKPYKKQVFNFDIKDAADIPFKNSPDLKVLIAERNAMKEALNYVQKTYLPDLTGDIGYGFNKTIPTSNNSLHVGVNLNTSVNLMELRHNIKGADAQIKIAEEEINNFKSNLFFEVQRAFNNVNMAEEKINITLSEIEASLETYIDVLEKYKNKKLNYLNVQEAKNDYINAIHDYINSLYEYNISLIQVEMAMHYHIADIHHKSKHAMHYHSEELIDHLNKVLDCGEEHKKKD